METKIESENDFKTGGKLYDEGGYGCIFIPPLKCKGEKKTILSKTIDKLMEKKEAEIEYNLAQRVRRIPLWKNYFLVAESICDPAPKSNQTDKNIAKCDIISKDDLSSYKLLRMQFGGVPLTQYRMNFYNTSFFDFIRHFLEAGALLCLFGIVHRDLHQGNILVDSDNVPRIIDFNLSIDIKKPIRSESIRHAVMMDLSQEPPDGCLVNALALEYKDGFSLIESILNSRKTLQKVQSILGISKDTMRMQLEDFYRRSQSAQKRDDVSWFRNYWRVIDSWAVGIIIIQRISGLLLWQSFRTSEFSQYSEQLYSILRDMCNLNPIYRIDCVQALQRLDPNNYIIRKYGKEWLERIAEKSKV